MSFIGGIIGDAAGSFIDKALGPIKEIAISWINKEISEAEFEAKVKVALLGALPELWKAQSDIIRAEIGSEDWLTRNWRPMVALISFFSLWWVIFAIPHLILAGLMTASPGFGEIGLGWFFTLTSICVGGYIGGRTIEKATKTIFGKDK